MSSNKVVCAVGAAVLTQIVIGVGLAIASCLIALADGWISPELKLPVWMVVIITISGISFGLYRIYDLYVSLYRQCRKI